MKPRLFVPVLLWAMRTSLVPGEAVVEMDGSVAGAVVNVPKGS